MYLLLCTFWDFRAICFCQKNWWNNKGSSFYGSGDRRSASEAHQAAQNSVTEMHHNWRMAGHGSSIVHMQYRVLGHLKD